MANDYFSTKDYKRGETNPTTGVLELANLEQLKSSHLLLDMTNPLQCT
jgi:hypothetical protein